MDGSLSNQKVCFEWMAVCPVRKYALKPDAVCIFFLCSDVVVQIVDARNPLLFWCPDLDKYVKEVDPKKQTLLLINKADLLTANQRFVDVSEY